MSNRRLVSAGLVAGLAYCALLQVLAGSVTRCHAGEKRSEPERVSLGEDIEWDAEGQLALNALTRSVSPESIRQATTILDECATGKRSHAGAIVREILRGLADAKAVSAIPALVGLVEARGGVSTQPEAVFRGAIRALLTIDVDAGIRAIETPLATYPSDARRTVAASPALRLRGNGIAILRRLAGDEDGDVRGAAVSNLAGTCERATSMSDIAFRTVSDPDAQVRAAALFWVGECRMEGAERVLLAALADYNPSVRLQAVEGLRRLASAAGCSTVDTLVQAEDDDNVRTAMRHYLAEACSGAGGSVEPDR